MDGLHTPYSTVLYRPRRGFVGFSRPENPTWLNPSVALGPYILRSTTVLQS